MTAGEVAEMLGVPTTWVYEQSRRGRIPTVTLGRYRRYRVEAIAEWVEQQEADAAKGAVPVRHRGGATRVGAR
jgi:excisionase family DNA binding protein